MSETGKTLPIDEKVTQNRHKRFRELKPPDSDLVIFRKKNEGPYRIRWIYEDGVEGMTIGSDLVYHGQKVRIFDFQHRPDPEHRKVTQTLFFSSDVGQDESGLFWMRLGQAEAALKQARKMINKVHLPLPFEAEALTRGWTPPKGWLPGNHMAEEKPKALPRQ